MSATSGVADLPMRAVAGVPTRLPLTELDIACGWPYGEDPHAGSFPEVPPDLTARQALEEAIIPALQRPPCVVSFSGGRDSSLVLAIATHVARREGLPDPVPATLRHPDVPSAEEDEWQELVVRHLGVDDWVRTEIWDELELLGPVATAAMHRHGLLWPANVHSHVSLMRVARSGTILTGLDGDGLLGGWRWRRLSQLATGRSRPALRDLLQLGLALSPPTVRRYVQERRLGIDWPWLRTGAVRTVRRAAVEERTDEPVRWDQRVARFARRRYLRILRTSYGLLAEDAGVDAEHPLLDPVFLAALARDGGRTGIGDRTDAMRWLAGELLPAAVIERDTKAEFTGVAVRSATRRFVASLDRPAVALPDLVDPDAAVGTWRQARPDARAASVLQATWLILQNRSGQDRRWVASSPIPRTTNDR